MFLIVGAQQQIISFRSREIPAQICERMAFRRCLIDVSLRDAGVGVGIGVEVTIGTSPGINTWLYAKENPFRSCRNSWLSASRGNDSCDKQEELRARFCLYSFTHSKNDHLSGANLFLNENYN